MRRIPGFDEKKLGYSGFKKLMLRVAQEGNIKLVTVGLVDWIIMADEPDPQEAHQDSAEAPRAAEVIDEAEEQTHLVPEVAGTRVGQSEVVNDNESGALARSSLANSDTGEPPSGPDDFSFVPDDALAGIELPPGPGDGQDKLRVVDLIVMADTLEHREGISHVAFNFLLEEIAQALEEGLKAEHEVIIRHWGQMHSRTYLTRLLRSLGNGDVFQRGWHTGKDKETGRSRRRSTFNLNRDHSLVQQVLGTRGPEVDPEYAVPAYPSAAPDEIDPDASEYPELVDPNFGAEPESPRTTAAANPGEGTSGIGRVMRLFSRS
jgi:hypothetical protein